MADSSPSATPASNDALQQSRTADALELITSAPGLPLPNWETPIQPLEQPQPLGVPQPMGMMPQPLGLPYGVHTSDGALIYQPPLPNQTFSTNHTYVLQPHYGNNPMMMYNQSTYHGNGNEDYNTYNQLPIANNNNLPGYGMDKNGLLGQFNEQPMQEDNDNNNSDSEDSDDGVATNANQVFEGVIRSEAHYNETLSRRLRKAILSDKASDIPKTEEDKKALVKQLFESITDTSDVLDKPSKNGKPAQAVRRLHSGYYSNKAIELKCWEILIRCRDAAMGHKILGSDAHSKKEDYEGFGPRFQKIVDSCRISKALCKQIMDPTYISRLVAAPGAEIQMKHNNKKINAERDIQNEIGRKAVKRGIKLNDLDLIAGAEAAVPTSFSDPDQEDVKVPIDQLGSPIEMDNGKPKHTVVPKTPKRASVPKKAVQSTSTLKTVSTKRKSAQTSKLGSDSDYETPVKRPRQSTKARAKATPTKTQGLNKTVQGSSPGPLSAIAASSNGTVLGNVVGDVEQQFTMSSAMNNMDLGSFLMAQTANNQSDMATLSAPVYPSLDGQFRLNEDMHHLEMSYKYAICSLLEVDISWTDLYSLHQLRTYARAYNSEFMYTRWRYDPDYTGLGHRLINQNGGTYRDHFAEEFELYRGLAIARGDLTQDGSYNPIASNVLGFPTQTDPQMRQALGLDPNPCGLHDDRHNDENYTHHQLIPNLE